MRINIEIDDALMAEAQQACGHATKKQAIEQALRLMIRLYRQGRSARRSVNTAGVAIWPRAVPAGPN
jgi:Arc/MetJ family transcription regulator